MSKAVFSVLFALLVATMCQAFAPAAQSRASTSLNAGPLRPDQNAYARGGKPSWIFEQETMFVEEPAPKKKKTVAKKAAPKKAAAKKAAGAPKNPFAFFGKK